MTQRIAVLGAGSWGTTLGNLLAKKGHDVVIWSFEPDVASEINDSSRNSRYLKGITLSGRLSATPSVTDAVQNAGVVVSVTPAQHVRRVMADAGSVIESDALIVSASKGIEMSSLETMAEVMLDTVQDARNRVAFLSGPSFALEVAREQPTAVAMASYSEPAARRAQELFQASYFRVYTNSDVMGVELGGSLKNVIAIAAGMASGLGLGHNTLAALITRGLAEIARLGVARGANPLTFSGLAGMGDLILTCTGELSRNRSVGVALGQGRSLAEILGDMYMVAEGVDTTRAAHALAHKAGIEMPIVAQVHAVLFEGRSAKDALELLMLRGPKPEQWG